MDIQHIMDYIPTTYTLHQQEETKTMVDLKLLKEILIDSSVNQCRLIGQKVCVKTLITLVNI